MGLFSDNNRIERIHKNYQKIIEYQNQRINALEEYLENEMGISAVTGDKEERQLMLFYAKTEGAVIPTSSDELFYHATALDPKDEKLGSCYTKEDYVYERQHSDLHLKAIVKIGNLCYRQTDSKINRIKIKVSEPTNTIKRVAREGEFRNILCTYYCRIVDGTQRKLSDAAWKCVCKEIGIDDRLYNAVKHAAYTYVRYRMDISDIDLIISNKGSGTKKIPVNEPDNEVNDTEYGIVEKLEKLYVLYCRHREAECYSKDHCQITNNNERCRELKEKFTPSKYDFINSDFYLTDALQSLSDAINDDDY